MIYRGTNPPTFGVLDALKRLLGTKTLDHYPVSGDIAIRRQPNWEKSVEMLGSGSSSSLGSLKA